MWEEWNNDCCKTVSAQKDKFPENALGWFHALGFQYMHFYCLGISSVYSDSWMNHAKLWRKNAIKRLCLFESLDNVLWQIERMTKQHFCFDKTTFLDSSAKVLCFTYHKFTNWICPYMFYFMRSFNFRMNKLILFFK